MHLTLSNLWIHFPGARLLISYVPTREKNDEKGYIFSTGQCAVLSQFRVGKVLFSLENDVCFFQNLQKVAEASKYMCFNLLHWKGLLNVWTQ